MVRAIGLGVFLIAFSTVGVAANRSDATFVSTSSQAPVPNTGGSCPTPPAIATLPFTDAGTTCGSTNSVSNYNAAAACSATLNFPYPGEDLAYRITVGASQSLNISATLTGSTGDLALFLIGTCGSGPSCLKTSQDAIGVGAGPETIPTVTGLAAGTYYVYVDSYYAVGSAGSCGSYTLNVTGTLPVALQSYGID